VLPERVVELEFNFRKVCNLNEIGTYKIVAEREVWPLDGRNVFRVVSKPFYLTVVPGRWEGTDAATNNVSKHW